MHLLCSLKRYSQDPRYGSNSHDYKQQKIRILYKLNYKRVAGFQRTDSNFEKFHCKVRCYKKSTVCYREIICERKSISVANLIIVVF